MEKELVTIIVPIYNVEKYLKECIESIINQTYKNLEIILVNDGSTDDSLKICMNYKKKDNRIVIINKTNGGLSDARNKGIDAANGKYICFVDSDDYISSAYVELLYNEARKNNTDIVLCGIKYVNDEKKILSEYAYKKNFVKSGKELLIDYYQENGVEVIVAWNKLYKRELFNTYRYNVGKIHEDEFLTYKILYNLDKVSIISDKLYYYRKNDTSIVNKKFNLKRLDLLEALENRMRFFKEKSENKLYILTVELYVWVLKDFYVKTKKYIDHSKNIQNTIIKKYKKMKKQFLKSKEITKIKKIKYLCFYFFYDVYSYIKN